MKVIGYVRVSTEEQAREGVSLAAQEAKLRAYAALYDLDLVAVVADAGVSAKTLNRPGLAQALAALDSGDAAGILVAKLDRLTRSVKDLGTLLDAYFSSKFTLLSVSDQIDTRTAGGRLVLNILASVSQWEREAIGERTSAALRHKMAQGVHIGAPALGYDLVSGELRANQEELAILQRVQALRAAGKTLREVADTLNAEGIRTKRGGRWHVNTVVRALERGEAA